MKQFKLSISLLIILSIFVLTGCDDIDDIHEDALEDRIERLELQVSELQNQIANNSGITASTNSTEATSTDNISASTEVLNPPQTKDPSDTLETLASAVDEVTAKADSAIPDSNSEEMRNQFFTLKNELEAVDNRLDDYDDYLELQYHQGTLSYDDYLTQERILDNLEDKLEASEDRLERVFGMND